MTAIKAVLEEALALAKENYQGAAANYIPELAAINEEYIGLSVTLIDGQSFYIGNDMPPITLQSAAKIVLLIGLLEECGADEVFSWVKTEPSGDDFNSLARLDQFGPYASNPMLNAGAIALSDHLPGKQEDQIAWLDTWMQTLFGVKCHVNTKVLASERRTGDRNRSLAYLLKSNGMLERPVKEVLETYFSLCSYEVSVQQASRLPMLLANGGKDEKGQQVITLETVKRVLAIMATCGLYNESGTHFLKTGMPAKSSVSGFILSTAIGNAGIAAFSPRVNRKGTSIRAEIMLEHLSSALSWHFADKV